MRPCRARAGSWTAEYTTPFVAHMTMETMNATVRLGADSCEIWSPVQAPDLARQVACDLTGLRRDQVTVHTTLAGSGFGRRALMDYVAEAVSIAKQLDRPVQTALVAGRRPAPRLLPGRHHPLAAWRSR